MVVSTPFTVEDLHRENEGRLLELVRGVPAEKSLASLSIWVVTQVSFFLKLALYRGDTGTVYTELPISCFPWLPEHARRPDVVYFSEEKLPFADVDVAAIPTVPDLCVEVLSRNDNALEVEAKIGEYLRAGVGLIWIVDPNERTVRVIRGNRQSQYLTDVEILTATPHLPGFATRVGDLFPPRRNHSAATRT